MSKDLLFVVAYHSYAGGNHVALLPTSPEAPPSKAVLNGTFIEFDLGQGDAYPYGLELNNFNGDSYWNWNAVGINSEFGDEGNNGVTSKSPCCASFLGITDLGM